MHLATAWLFLCRRRSSLAFMSAAPTIPRVVAQAHHPRTEKRRAWSTSDCSMAVVSVMLKLVPVGIGDGWTSRPARSRSRSS